MTLLRLGLIYACAALLIDQVTKSLVRIFAHQLEAPWAVLPFLNIVLGHNTGVSFGLLKGVPSWSLIVLAIVVVAVLCSMLWRSETKGSATGLGLVIGGAVGNVLDRIAHGAVTDWLDFHAMGFHWPAFNLADFAIFCGVTLILLGARRSQPA